MPSVLSCCPEAALCLLAIIHKGTASQTGTTGASERLCKSGQPFQVLKWTCRSLAGKGIFWVSSLLTYFANFGLTSLHNHMSQFFKISLSLHTHIYIYIHLYICIPLSLSLSLCVYIYIYIYIYIQTHTHTYTYMYTHTHFIDSISLENPD